MYNEKDLELNFKHKVNDITKSNKSIAIFIDGDSKGLKSKMIDKLLDWTEPSRYKLIKYKRTKFNIKKFWKNSPSEKTITIFDGSYHKEIKALKKKNKYEELKDIKFYEEMMNKYGFITAPIIFKEDKSKHNLYEVKEREGIRILYVYTNDEDKAFEALINYLIGKIDEVMDKPITKFSNVAKLSERKVDLNSISNNWKYTNDDEYKKELKKLKKEIKEIHEKLINKDKSVAVVFQGIDGAGKSSTINRLTSKMVPHWYNVYGIRKPTEEELQHSYLWRFWTKLPDKGEIAIFDRSWYERLTAERVLELNNNEWVNAVPEIEEFERELQANGIKVVKFWFNIDKETQGKRFEEREKNSLKRWKISKADYETREKWDEYQIAFSEMLGATDWRESPWHYIDSRDKKEARINTMRIFVKEVKDWLKSLKGEK